MDHQEALSKVEKIKVCLFRVGSISRFYLPESREVYGEMGLRFC